MASLFLASTNPEGSSTESTFSAEVAAAREAVWRHRCYARSPNRESAYVSPILISGRFVLYGAFDYYALEGVINDSGGSDADIYSISFNAFHRFCTEMRWECDECPSSHFDIIFTQVRATYTGRLIALIRSMIVRGSRPPTHPPTPHTRWCSVVLRWIRSTQPQRKSTGSTRCMRWRATNFFRQSYASRSCDTSKLAKSAMCEAMQLHAAQSLRPAPT